jgi:N-acylneuraminate cytidylyltransferase
MIAAVVTARGGSSWTDKNLLRVGDRPLVVRQVEAAQSSGVCTGGVYCLTDGPGIAAAAAAAGATIIDEPAHLASADANHGDAIVHAGDLINADLGGRLSVLVVLLGNTAMVSPQDVVAAVQALDDHQDADSCMTVWRAADDHPLRALTLDEHGWLVPYPCRNRRAPTNRQQYPAVYYYDNGVWALRTRCLRDRNGAPNPWWWMGQRCIPIVRDWVTGRDIHGPLDLAIARWWVEEGHTHAAE